LQYVDKKIFTQ